MNIINKLVHNKFLISILLFVVLFLILYYDLIIGDKIFIYDVIIWWGSFYYYVDSIVNYSFPFWNPYMLTGSPFYQDIHVLGLLDPLIWLPILLAKLGLSYLSAYKIFCLSRLLIFILGSYFLFKYITKSKNSALISSVVLLFSTMPVGRANAKTTIYFHQMKR
jgi:hypothetical protein